MWFWLDEIDFPTSKLFIEFDLILFIKIIRFVPQSDTVYHAPYTLDLEQSVGVVLSEKDFFGFIFVLLKLDLAINQ